MIYFKKPSGEVFAYETHDERDLFGAPDLVAMTEAEVAAHLYVPPPAAPASVTMRQARLALLGAGLLTSIDAAIEQMPEPERSAARIEWEYAQTVDRNSPFTQQLASGLGLTSEQLDALFTQAAAL